MDWMIPGGGIFFFPHCAPASLESINHFFGIFGFSGGSREETG